MSKAHRLHLVTKGAVGNKQVTKDLSEEPAMQELQAVFDNMTDDEKERTLDFLTGKKDPEIKQ